MHKENQVGQNSSSEALSLSETNTPQNIYEFPFLQDPRFLNHKDRTILTTLAGPENTIQFVKEAARDLALSTRLTVIRKIPSIGEMWRIVPPTGIACRGPAIDTIELYFDPDNSHTIDSLKYRSGRQIAHELNHVAREKFHPLHKTLLDALVSEGLGIYHEEHFQNEKAASIQGNVLARKDIQKEWVSAKLELFSEQFNFGDWFFGNFDGHSRFAGYSLGNAIISNFFDKYPRYPISEAITLPSQKILQNTDFSN